MPPRPIPLNRQTSTQQLDGYVDAVKKMYVNKFFGAFLFGFFVLMYFYLRATLPTLKMKSAWALGVCVLVGGASNYALHRDGILEVESGALAKLRKEIQRRIMIARAEMTNFGDGVVVWICGAVSTIVQAPFWLAATGLAILLDIFKHSFHSVLYMFKDIIHGILASTKFGRDLVREIFDPIEATLILAWQRVSAAVELSARAIWKNKPRLFLIIYALDLLLPDDTIGEYHMWLRTISQENLTAALLCFGVLLCMVVASWKPVEQHPHQA
jgi:hypothetical protein